ncbi:MAG: DUF3095 domain-containing protein [Elusimicrobia bacterium]|nr:DUF3095 domain-containing protein [Elusimicrobiota bacterium]
MFGDLFQVLDPFEQFSELTEDRHFLAVPDDWTVFIADVAGSTQAIEEGRYKDVNTLGAACIAAAQNAMERASFPYSFGGDGATLLAPPEYADRVAAALAGVRSMAARTFGMTLRVGRVSVGEIRKEGRSIEVARFHLASEQSITLFRGGGVLAAEAKVKDPSGRYLLPPGLAGESDLQGLSCRWEAIPSRNGIILSLIVMARSISARPVYRSLIVEIDRVLGGDARLANPVNSAGMRYRTMAKLLNDERRYHASVLSPAFLRRAAEIVGAVLVFRLGMPNPLFDTGQYFESLNAHADYRKFDDVLRMVIDCTKAQAEDIRSLLEELRAAGQVYYGVHESDAALMTCFVKGMSEGRHVHFIDGSAGGYALAAKQYKAQMKADRVTP